MDHTPLSPVEEGGVETLPHYPSIFDCVLVVFSTYPRVGTFPHCPSIFDCTLVVLVRIRLTVTSE